MLHACGAIHASRLRGHPWPPQAWAVAANAEGSPDGRAVAPPGDRGRSGAAARGGLTRRRSEPRGGEARSAAFGRCGRSGGLAARLEGGLSRAGGGRPSNARHDAEALRAHFAAFGRCGRSGGLAARLEGGLSRAGGGRPSNAWHDAEALRAHRSPRWKPGDSGWWAFPGAMRCGCEPGNCVPSSGMDGGMVFIPGVPGFPPGAFWVRHKKPPGLLGPRSALAAVAGHPATNFRWRLQLRHGEDT